MGNLNNTAFNPQIINKHSLIVYMIIVGLKKKKKNVYAFSFTNYEVCITSCSVLLEIKTMWSIKRYIIFAYILVKAN